jgi:beta-aspartyl-peptidase (threonine type)
VSGCVSKKMRYGPSASMRAAGRMSGRRGPSRGCSSNWSIRAPMARTIRVAAGGLSAAIVSQMSSKLARAVMEKSEHVFLIGEGAERFAREHGTSFEDAEYFLTEARIAQLAEAEKKQATVLDHSQTNERKLGTVGAVARDRSSNLAATTSTGGLVNQHWGRVGDSAIIGAGVFADNASCAVSCTGIGEHLLRTSLAKTAALFIEYRGVRADEAADAAIRYLVDKVHGLDGLIIVDRDGTCARANSLPGMLTATAENDEVRIQTT